MRSDQRLLFAFDETYAQPGLVAMHTALIHSPATVDVTVASVGLSSETIDRLRRRAEIHDCDLSIIEAEELVDALPSGLPRFSPAAWARVFIDRIIPEDTARVVYLDADTFCRGPIHELFEIDLGISPLAAVPDPIEPTHQLRGAEYWRAAATSPSSSYFNSGVMVIDRSSWVERDVTGEALRMIADRRVPTRSVDQDILNAVLWERWVPLPSIWNTLGNASGAHRDARIVHFMGDHKPWRGAGASGPFAEEYRRQIAGVGSF